MEEFGRDSFSDEFISYTVEMDVAESSVEDVVGSPVTSPSHSTVSSLNNRCFATRKPGKGWKRRYIHQRSRREKLSSRKLKTEDSDKISARKAPEKCEPCKHVILPSNSLSEGSSGISSGDVGIKESCAGEDECENTVVNFDNNCSCTSLESVQRHEEDKDVCTDKDESLSLELSTCNSKSKRHSERDLESPKPRKSRRPTDQDVDLSFKYSTSSFCSIEDHLPDGFYDAGRDRPFLPLSRYEENLELGSREVIVMDREMDEELDAATLGAQSLVFHFKHNYRGSAKEQGHVPIDILQVASLLALFVSDHFGGSDRSGTIERTRKAVSGSNYSKPFVCTCPTGNSDSIQKSAKQSFDCVDDIVLRDLCERSLQAIKAKRNSIVVPIGTLQFGVCRHRALLMKYLCDRMEPRVPCELVRGYLDFSPHAWNVIVIKRGDRHVRMIVDACHPNDIREENDPEYFCRYIPLCRINVPSKTISNPDDHFSFPSLAVHEEIVKNSATSLVKCNLGSFEAAAKVRTLEISGASSDDIKNFEFNCLGEVRILSTLKNSCIVEVLGHQISSRWASSGSGIPERRILQSAIFMENIKEGSLKNYVEKLVRAGEKHVPTELAMHIARDIACALVEIHSKDIMHRDIKSENVLIDLKRKKSDGTPVVKLCDFDRAIPVRSCLHTCCISHCGIPAPDICVGTPRWMAPEVFRTIHEPHLYGLEVDIWSFGCLLFELLTLEVPYSGLSDLNIQDLLLIGKRPPLPMDLEALDLSEDSEVVRPGKELKRPETESETLRFLVDLYRKCTQENPQDRPSANDLYQMLASRTISLTNSEA